MLRSMVRSALLLAAFIVSHGCNHPTAVIEGQDFENSYAPLRVGIEKQYFNFSDSTYQNNKISGEAIREDGQVVFIDAHNNPGHNTVADYSYSFIRGGYLYSTSLIKRENEKNPFGEIRIAKLFPQDGESWVLSEAAGSETVVFTAHFVGEITTPAGMFEDVYNFQYFDKLTSDTANVYYTKGVGHLGSSSRRGLILVNYVKIGNKEYGKQVPIALLTKR